MRITSNVLQRSRANLEPRAFGYFIRGVFKTGAEFVARLKPSLKKLPTDHGATIMLAHETKKTLRRSRTGECQGLATIARRGLQVAADRLLPTAHLELQTHSASGFQLSRPHLRADTRPKGTALNSTCPPTTACSP